MLDEKDLKKIGHLLDIRLKRELRPIKHDLTKIRRDIDVMLDLFDRDVLLKTPNKAN